MLIATIFDVLMIFAPFIAAALLGVVIYYFLRSRRSLKSILLSHKNLAVIMDYDPGETEFSKRKAKTVALKSVPATNNQKNVIEFNNVQSSPEAIHTLKDSIIHQRSVLENLLNKVQEIEEKKVADIESKVDREELKEKIELLEWKLKEKEQELQKIRNLEAGSKKTAEKLEEVYREFELLQSKIERLEKQAGRANTVEMELEKSKNEYEQLKKDISKKADKIEELTAETQKKHQQLCEAEDKLAKTNRKLHGEMRRIGELESMLHMISEERDHLLHKSK
jgi:chromosome segregation ATPase